MSEDTLTRIITVPMIRNALNLVCFHAPDQVEEPEPACDWSAKLCPRDQCLFPRYFRDGQANGLTAQVLLGLGYPVELLKDLDREYEMGEVLHPGVKIGRSRNAALGRIVPAGMALLSFLQENQKTGLSWGEIATLAFRPRALLVPKIVDSRRRPWCC